MAKAKRQREKIFEPSPKSIKKGFHLNSEKFHWSFEKCLWEHGGWRDCKDIKFFVEHMVSKLQELEKSTWQEILTAAGGKSEGHGNNNHFINGINLPSEERRKFIELDYMRDYEKVFSLRLSGRERLIGVVDLNVFNILWFDANHKFF